MKKQVYSGRYTVENEEEIVVFLIGMRINQRLAVHKWLPVFSAMPRMIKELYTHKDTLGFLSMESYFGLRTTLMVQYLAVYRRFTRLCKRETTFNSVENL